MTKMLLYVDTTTGKKLPDIAVLRSISEGLNFLHATKSETSLALIAEQQDIYILVINSAYKEIILAYKRKFPNGIVILVTDETMNTYSQSLDGKEEKLIDHFIANRLPASWTIDELRVTIQSLARNNLFGINRYLQFDCPIHNRVVKGTSCRGVYNHEVMKFAESHRLNKSIAKLVYGITEELLMNAIYDAPAAVGVKDYASIDQNQDFELKEDHYSEFSYGFDGTTFAISVSDPFGALPKNQFFKYLKKVLHRDDSTLLIDVKKGGAGLGLFKILYSSHSLICSVTPNKKTQVISLIDVHHQIRDFSKMARSVHYFTTNSQPQ